MMQVEIMYNNIERLLNEIANNPDNPAFIATLGEEDSQKFLDIIEFLLQEIDVILQAKLRQELYPNYQLLEDQLDTIFNNFREYNLSRYAELKILIAISKVITNAVTDLTDPNPIDTSLFELLELDANLSIPQHFYIFENTTTFEDSTVLLSLNNYDTLENELGDQLPTISLLFTLLSKIGGPAALNQTKHVMIRSGHTGHQKKINGFLLLQMISDGHVVHIPKRYIAIPGNQWKTEITIGNQYQQFLDVFDVLSEYNSSKEVIEKYLKLYQVIEDYMYKSALVKLERQKNGDIFSLRDFKRMNEDVSEREITALKQFISDTFALEISPGITFNQHFYDEWQILGTQYPSINQLDQVISLFKVMDGDNLFTFATVTRPKLIKFIHQLIYFLRNSIVHNKTTEFHLTYRTLTADIYLLFEKFLIPNIEKLIFYLTVKPTSNVVWFQNPALRIWQSY